MSNTWRLDRSDTGWAGPITTSVTDDAGQPVTDATITFAVVPDLLGVRPADDDWAPPVVNPDDPDEIGVAVTPVADYAKYGVWARATRGDDVTVLKPTVVGYIQRL